MEVLLSFIIKNIEGHTDQRYQKDYPEDMSFIDVLRDILKILDCNITLDKIAVISAIKGLFSYDDIRKTVKEIVAMHLLEFTITKRDLVNGSNLMLKELIPATTHKIPPKDIQYGFLKSKIEPETSTIPEPMPEPMPEPIPEPIPEPPLKIQDAVMSDLKPLETEIFKERLDGSGTIGGIREETADIMEEMSIKQSMEDQLEEVKMSQKAMDSVIEEEFGEDKVDYVEAKFEKIKEKEKALPPPGSALPPPGSAPEGLPKSPHTLRGSMTQELNQLFKKKEEKKSELPTSPPSLPPAGPPSGPPKTPPKLRDEMKQELKRLHPEMIVERKPEPPSRPSVSGSGAPPPSPAPHRPKAKPSISPPPPSPPPSPLSSEPVDTSSNVESFSFKAKSKKKGKKMAARKRSFAAEMEDSAPVLKKDVEDDLIGDDFEEDMEKVRETREAREEIEEEPEEAEEVDEAEETDELISMEFPPSLKSALVPDLIEISNEMETRKEYQKNIAIEYFDKMNPKKYYPLIVDISDIEQVTTISEENILTGERKTQVKEKMAVFLKSSIVKVKPMFPGCSIVPEERYTDLDKKEDKLTFYVTPLVDDEIEDGRVEFVDSEGNVFHSASTPSKVEDPRYARVIALYGGLVSFLPKILETLGFSFAADTQMATIFPFLQVVLGDMNLSNFIGISGILITIVIAVITMVVRKPNSVKKKFKVARVGRLKTAINFKE